MRGRWLICCRTLALGFLASFVALSPAVAGAADSEETPGQLQVIQIGSQVVAVDAVGNAVLYGYPPGEAPDCEGLEACWGFSCRHNPDPFSSGVASSRQGPSLQRVSSPSSVLRPRPTPHAGAMP